VPSEKIDGGRPPTSSKSTGRVPRLKVPIRSATISADGATPTSPCWVKRSPAPKSIADDKVAEFLSKNEFKTIMGDWKYGPGGEWTKTGMLQVQYHDHQGWRRTRGLEGMSYQTVLTPTSSRPAM